jgi:hypothetical protein
MQPREAEVFLNALNRTGQDGEDQAAGVGKGQGARVALLQQRLRAARGEAIALQVELERARKQIAEQQTRIGMLDGLLKNVYAARSYRMANWLHGSLSALAGFIAGRRRIARQAVEREGR